MSAVFGPALSLLELCLYGHERNFGCVTTVSVCLTAKFRLAPYDLCDDSQNQAQPQVLISPVSPVRSEILAPTTQRRVFASTTADIWKIS